MAEGYQREKFTEEKDILVKQVDSLTERNSKISAESQQVQADLVKVKEQLAYTQGSRLYYQAYPSPSCIHLDCNYNSK